MSQAAVIELRAVSKRFSRSPDVLCGVDLQVCKGEIVTLLGPSGCGKTTVLRLIAGLTPPTTGEVRVHLPAGDTSDARFPAAWGGISYVFQDPTLMPWASVLANVRLPLDLAGVDRETAHDRALQALASVGLQRVPHLRPHELSGGMRMRASIARALVTQPTLLLMDEPFAALDEITRHKLDADLLRLCAQRSISVLFVTHSIYESVFLSDRVLVMGVNPGRVIADVGISEPHPRSASFRVSTRFAHYAQQLQEQLIQASGGNPEEAMA